MGSQLALSHVRVRFVRFATIVLLTAGVTSLGGFLAPPAEAAVMWRWQVQPTGTVSTAMPVIVQGMGTLDAYPFDISTIRMSVDGVLVPRASYTALIRATPDLYLYYMPGRRLTDGPHTFNVQLADTLGRVSAYQWSCTVKMPPDASWTAPVKGAVDYTGKPVIGLTLSDNTPGTTFTVTGQVRKTSPTGAVAATFAGTGLAAGESTFSLASELPPGTYYLTATITDAAGAARTLSGAAARTFTSVSAPAQSVFTSRCLDCHTKQGHPAATRTCEGCHTYVYHEYADCQDCHLYGHPEPTVTVRGVTGDCTNCHNSSAPATPQHTPQNVVPAHTSGCNGCHTESLVAVHAVTPAGSGYAYQCGVCHLTSNPRVKAAVAAQDTSCSACHDVAPDHPSYDAALHQSTETCMLTCHQKDLAATHDAASPPVGCSQCHSAKLAEVRPWDATCTACHPVIAHASANHAGSDAGVRNFRTTSSAIAGCSDTDGRNRGCHNLGDVSILHSQRSDKGCTLCHSAGAVAATECISCHLKYLTGETKTGFLSDPVIPSGDGTATAGISVFPASPGTRFGKIADAPGTVGDYDGTYVSYDALDGPHVGSLYSFTPVQISTPLITPPATANITVTGVRLYYRARRVGTSTLPKLGASLNVGGTVYNLAAPAVVTPAAAYPTAAQPPYFNITTNPKTGAAWTVQDVTSLAGENALQEFGLYSTNVTNPIRVTQCYAVIAYNVTLTTTAGTQSNSMYHHNNAKYLRDPADAQGKLWAVSPPSGWTGVLYEQDCQDKCHRNYWGAPVYSAHQGTYMWHSMAGAGGNAAAGPTTRTLTLRPVVVPVDQPKLEFMTNWRLNTAGKVSSTGYVEISTDGEVYVPLTGTVGGVEMSAITENATAWVPAVYDLSAYAGQSVRLRFRYVVGTDNACGWAFDSLSVNSASGPVFTDDAETLKPDWTNSYWNRSIGAFIYQ